MTDNLPYFSIVIPTYNRPRELAGCLDSFRRLDYPRERFEIIVVDDGGKEDLDAVVEPFREDFDITLLKQPNTGPAGARNAGVERAKGEFIACTDDDCTPDKAWLKSFAARFAETPECIIGGRIVNAQPENLYSTASQLLIDYLYVYYNSVPDRARFFTGNNLAVPSASLKAIGSFDITYPRTAGEDRELCDRWLQAGGTMLYAPEAVVSHSNVLTFTTLCRQHFTYGRGAYCFRKIRARRTRSRIKVEPLSFYLELVRFPFSRTEIAEKVKIAALLVVAQAMNAAGFFWEMACKKLKRQDEP